MNPGVAFQAVRKSVGVRGGWPPPLPFLRQVLILFLLLLLASEGLSSPSGGAFEWIAVREAERLRVPFGFAAIAHRHRVLGCSPPDVPTGRTVDFAEVLKAHYGEDYAPHPRLASLTRLNEVSELDALAISELARLYREGKFALIERSLCRRLRVLTCLFAKFAAGTLKHTGQAVGNCPLRTALTKTATPSTPGGDGASVVDPSAGMKGFQRKLVMALRGKDFCPIDQIAKVVYGEAASLKAGAFGELLKRTRRKLLDVAPQCEVIRRENRLKLQGPQEPASQQRPANDQVTRSERKQGQSRGTMTERE
jgi:hypothetical protein